MRAKSKSKYVYTAKGYDPEYEKLDNIVPLSVAPTGATPVPADISMAKLCPHDGQYLKGIPMCAICLNDPLNGFSNSDKWLAFVKMLNDVCSIVAWKKGHRDFKAIPVGDRKSICFLAIWKNLTQILEAKNPLAYAHVVADRALIGEERKRNNWNERNSTGLKLPAFDREGNQQLQTTTDRLEFLDAAARERNLNPDWYQFDEGDVGVRIFPGAKLLWTPENVERLMFLANEAMNKLPSWPFNCAEAIRYRSGYRGGKGCSWPQLAEMFNDPAHGRPVTERQVRYGVLNGLDKIRRHIFHRLTPDLGEIIDRNTLKINGL